MSMDTTISCNKHWLAFDVTRLLRNIVAFDLVKTTTTLRYLSNKARADFIKAETYDVNDHQEVNCNILWFLMR